MEFAEDELFVYIANRILEAKQQKENEDFELDDDELFELSTKSQEKFKELLEEARDEMKDVEAARVKWTGLAVLIIKKKNASRSFFLLLLDFKIIKFLNPFN